MTLLHATNADPSAEDVYQLWLASWETELGAVEIASQTGSLSTSEAAAHRALIAAEREVVVKQLTLLRW